MVIQHHVNATFRSQVGDGFQFAGQNRFFSSNDGFGILNIAALDLNVFGKQRHEGKRLG